MASAEKSKAELIEERKANLPLPEDPPGPSDFNSADARTVNIEAGDVAKGDLSQSNDPLRDPATGESAVRTDGLTNKTNTQGADGAREGADKLGGLPNDAVTRDAKDKAGLVDTTGK